MTWEEEVAWCRQQWALLRDGGMWGVPRSGLIFCKDARAKELVLVGRMPHDPRMTQFDGSPLTAEQLREQQDGEVEEIGKRFAEFGVTITERIEV